MRNSAVLQINLYGFGITDDHNTSIVYTSISRFRWMPRFCNFFIDYSGGKFIALLVIRRFMARSMSAKALSLSLIYEENNRHRDDKISDAIRAEDLRSSRYRRSSPCLRAKTRARLSSPLLSPVGNARRRWFPVITTTYVNLRTFAYTAEHIESRLARQSSRHIAHLRAFFYRRAISLPGTSCVATDCIYVYMYKHSYARWSRSKTITYYLNLITALTAHYTAPREKRFFRSPLLETRRKGSTPGPSLLRR